MSGRKRYITSVITFVVVAFFVGLVVGVNIGRRSRVSEAGPAVDSGVAADQPPEYPQAPDFSLTDPLTDEVIGLKDFAGSNMVLLITTTTCPVCRKQIDELKTIYAEYTDKGVKFVNGVIPAKSRLAGRMIFQDDLGDYVSQSGLPFPAYLDDEYTLAEDYDVQAVPVLAFITSEGRLMSTRTFTYAKDLSKILDALIEGKEIDISGMPTLTG